MKLQNELPNFKVVNGFLKPYTYKLQNDQTTFHILVLKVGRSNMVTVNSKSIWNIKMGRIDGIRFVTSSSKLIHLKDFLSLENPIIVYRNKPYKTLKYLNESDVVDISDVFEVNGITLFHSFAKFVDEFQKK